MIYLLPLFLLIIGFKVYDRPYTQKKGIGLWIFVLICLVLIIGLRYKVGGDTYNYMNYFGLSPELNYWEPFDTFGFEPGFSLLTSAIKTISDNLYVYQTIIAFLLTFMLMIFIRRNTPYKFLALLLIYISMFLYFSTEVIRESLAIMIDKIPDYFFTIQAASTGKYHPKYAAGSISKEELMKQDVLVAEDSIKLGDYARIAILGDEAVDLEELGGYDFTLSNTIKYEYLCEALFITETGVTTIINHLTNSSFLLTDNSSNFI